MARDPDKPLKVTHAWELLAKEGLDYLRPVMSLDERSTVLEWMLAEWNTYSNKKFNLVDVPEEQRDDHDRSMLEHGFTSKIDDAFWFRQVTQYFSRAELFGLDTLQGRQALMKGLMTLFDCCACMVRVHGDPPSPGVPSGEIGEWERV